MRGRSLYLEQQCATFVHNQPVARLWRGLRAVPGGAGFELKEERPLVGRTLYSGWKEGSRIRIRIHRVKGGVMVRLTEMFRDNEGKVATNRERDDLEWQLIERLDPDGALAIMRQANERQKEVFDSYHACGGCARVVR